jgi:hypothetical protein
MAPSPIFSTLSNGEEPACALPSRARRAPRSSKDIGPCPAITFPDRRIGADSQQCPFLGPAGSVVFANTAVPFLGLPCRTPRTLPCAPLSAPAGRATVPGPGAAALWRNPLPHPSSDDGAAGAEKQGAAVDPGHGERSSSLHGRLADRCRKHRPTALTVARQLARSCQDGSHCRPRYSQGMPVRPRGAGLSRTCSIDQFPSDVEPERMTRCGSSFDPAEFTPMTRSRPS